jgi:uncharacterized protein YecE (DUF72 family)
MAGDATTDPAALAALVRFGTSSFSSADWVGPFYPPGAKAGDFLSLYAREMDTVEVDATYYAIPNARLVDSWVAKTPPGFLLSAKFPRSIVHGGESEAPDARRVLAPDATYEARDRFLEVMRRLGDRLGVLLMQFPYFNRGAFPSAGPFVERLDRFLADLPRDGLTYAVEVRNKAWVKPDLVDVLRRHRASLTLVDQAWMPHGDEMEGRVDLVPAEPAYVRLLGDRKEIEAITKRWSEEVIDRGERLARWASLLGRLARRGVRSLVYVNNHYAGHAPTTVRRLKQMYLDEIGAGAP